MRRISRYIERNYVLFLIVELKFGRIVAFVTIKNKKPVDALRTTFYIEVEVFYLYKALLIYRLAIINKVDNLVRR